MKIEFQKLSNRLRGIIIYFICLNNFVNKSLEWKNGCNVVYLYTDMYTNLYLFI